MSEPAAAGPSSFFRDLGDVFFSPGQAFARIARHRRFLAPMLVTAALGVLFTGVWLAKADLHEFMRAQVEDSAFADRFRDMPAEQQAETLDSQVRVTRVTAWLGPLVFGPAAIVFAAAVFLFVFRFFHGAELEAKQSVAVVAWTFLAYSLVSTPLALLVFALKGDWNLHPGQVLQANLGGLLDKAATPRPLLALAESVDLFTAWMMALLSIGYGAAIERPASSAAWGVVGVWLAVVVLKVGLAGLAALF
ncbi:MAG TPA: YIP1 family protein [Vicinamibacteria bacterium]|nr:YIP1 family protein [Vicinamibacteria bacterium]